MGWIDYVILGVVTALCGGIIAYLVSAKRKGKGSCGCGCNGCPHAEHCSPACKNEKSE